MSDDDIVNQFIKIQTDKNTVEFADITLSAIDERLRKIANVSRDAAKLPHIVDSERHIISNAPWKILNGWGHIRDYITSVRDIDADQYEFLVTNINHLVLGLIDGVSKGTTSKSARKFWQRKPLEIARDKKRENNNPRDVRINDAIKAAVSSLDSVKRWPSEWKLADAIRSDVRKRLKGSGHRIDTNAISKRLIQLFEKNELSHSALIERSEDPRQASQTR